MISKFDFIVLTSWDNDDNKQNDYTSNKTHSHPTLVSLDL